MSSASISSTIPRIEVDVWLEAGREGRCFTYLDGKQLGVGLGDLVLVRLRGRRITGVVVAVRESRMARVDDQGSSNGYQIQLVEAILQPAAVDPSWREWLEEVAIKCHITPFRMLKTALPPGWLGQRIPKESYVKRFWWVKVSSDYLREKNISKRQSELISFLLSRGGGSWQKDLQREGFGLQMIKGLITRGIVLREKREEKKEIRELITQTSRQSVLEAPRKLNKEQSNAVDLFNEQPPGSSFLLWGVTGSGKTEVYLQVASKELEEGRNCLILTPEIGLIPQLVDRCRKRFGRKVLEYHSGCSDKERVSTWREILSSSYPMVVVGTRSAIFLPLSPLGLIVLDEEHDSSYKQESPMPCYHAREVALDRAKGNGARVLLGTATPSLATWKSLSPNGPIALARLNSRISEKPLPAVQVVDMRNELVDGHKKLISRPLMNYLSKLPEDGEQALILVPRRGYSSFLSCRSCGEVVQCPHCDVALTVHKGRSGMQWLRCHWCDYRAEVKKYCDSCGSSFFKPFGAGTQRVIELLSNELKGLRLLRFDRDTTAGRDGHRRLLERFASGEADVLVGTQMLAKGMDMPKVTLAAVLAADGLLHRPDLQAGEQCLQLLMQLAGRAGRGERPGKVLVQTYTPEHPVIIHLKDGRYEEFLKEEAELRREAGLVPYRRACLLRLSGKSNSITATAATVIAEKVRPICNERGWCLVGPAPSMIPRVADRSRWQILIHGPEKSSLPLPFGEALWDLLPKGINLSVDPDPINL